jgi:hypothetical protein
MTDIQLPSESLPARASERKALLSRLGLRRAGSRLGLVVVAVGLVVIGIGWNGAAGSGGEINHVPVVQAQLPWVLSGGFLGLGIVVLGASIVIANAYRESEARMAARFEALLDGLERLSSLSPTTAGDATRSESADDLVVAGTASYHRPDCRLARGRREARMVTVETAVHEGLAPCRVCRPPVLV